MAESLSPADQSEVVGVVSGNGIRDTSELRRPGSHCCASGLVPSHGIPCLLTVSVPVEIDGVGLLPGDLGGLAAMGREDRRRPVSSPELQEGA